MATGIDVSSSPASGQTFRRDFHGSGPCRLFVTAVGGPLEDAVVSLAPTESAPDVVVDDSTFKNLAGGETAQLLIEPPVSFLAFSPSASGGLVAGVRCVVDDALGG